MVRVMCTDCGEKYFWFRRHKCAVRSRDARINEMERRRQARIVDMAARHPTVANDLAYEKLRRSTDTFNAIAYDTTPTWSPADVSSPTSSSSDYHGGGGDFSGGGASSDWSSSSDCGSGGGDSGGSGGCD